jgi:hypothetical protein
MSDPYQKENSFWDLAWHHLQFSPQTCYYYSLFWCVYLLSAEGEIATCFWLEVGLYFSLHAESERICCSLEYWVLLYHSLLLNLVIMAYIYYCFRFQQCWSASLTLHLTQHTVTNCLFAALEFRQSFCRLPTCMFNKCHRRFPDTHNIIF